jgi:hypothetical protein
MQNGQVTLEELVSTLSTHFNHVHLLWSSSNFCEFVASDDPEKIEHFLSLLGPVVQPADFSFESTRLGAISSSPSDDGGSGNV